MKKLGIALMAISMCFACGDSEDRDTLAEGEYENLEDAYERDNATLDALDRCDVAAATMYNNDELLTCEAAFESCTNLEVGRITNYLECEAGFTDNCSDDNMDLSEECEAGYGTLMPEDNCGWGCWAQRLASGTSWCGAGTDLAETPCPGTGAMSWSPNYDLGADKACRRHDHGAKHQALSAGVKLGCDIDRDLVNATDNWAAHGVFGNFGLAAAWGCFDYGCSGGMVWRSKWWGGYYSWDSCKHHGEHTHYGPTRHYVYSHTYGYIAKQQECSGDIW